MKIKPEFVFKDDRGELIQLFNLDKWKEVNYFTIKKGKTRGGHYHKKIIEILFVIQGEIKLTLETKISKRSSIIKQGAIIEIKPFIKHTLKAKKKL